MAVSRLTGLPSITERVGLGSPGQSGINHIVVTYYSVYAPTVSSSSSSSAAAATSSAAASSSPAPGGFVRHKHPGCHNAPRRTAAIRDGSRGRAGTASGC